MRSFVLVVRPVPGRDDERSPQDALCGARMGHPPWSQVVRQKSADGNRRGHNGTGGRKRSTEDAVPVMGDRSKFAGTDCGCGRIRSHRPGKWRSCRWGVHQLPFCRLGFDAFDGEPARSKRNHTIHHGDPLPIRCSRSWQIASALSQSPRLTPAKRQNPLPNKCFGPARVAQSSAPITSRCSASLL